MGEPIQVRPVSIVISYMGKVHGCYLIAFLNQTLIVDLVCKLSEDRTNTTKVHKRDLTMSCIFIDYSTLDNEI